MVLPGSAAHWMTGALAGWCSLVVPIQAAAQEPAFAGVHVGRAYLAYHRTREADERVLSEVERMNRERQELQAEGHRLLEAMEALRRTASDPDADTALRLRSMEEADAKAERLRAMEMQFRSRRQEEEAELDAMRRALLREIMEEIHATIRGVAREQGTRFILDTGHRTSLDTEWVLYIHPRADLTDEVIRRINAPTRAAD